MRKTCDFAGRHVGRLGAACRVSGVAADGRATASEWVEGHSSRARLIGGGGGMAGVELQLPEGWKTYWRYRAKPAACRRRSTGRSRRTSTAPRCSTRRRSVSPTRPAIPSATRARCVFPVRLKPKDASQADRRAPRLRLRGVQGHLHSRRSRARADSCARRHSEGWPKSSWLPWRGVPAPPEARREADPVLKRAVAELSGDKPRLLLETEFPGGAEHADAFVEAPGRALRAAAEEDRRRRQGRA